MGGDGAIPPVATRASGSVPAGSTCIGQAERRLSAARARALLTELLVGFGSQGFQRKLTALIAASVEAAGKEPGEGQVFLHVGGRRKLALAVQREVLPRYGFDGSHNGVQEMVEAIQPFLQDPQIAELSDSIREKLRLPQLGVDNDERRASASDAPSTRLQRETALALHGELLGRCSDPDFRERLRRLLRGAPDDMQRDCGQLLREAQAEVLPKYGFEASDDGVREMTKAVRHWLSDPEIQRLGRAIEEQLTACISEALTDASA
mmetsp:Transcript_92706/g.239400  ORF Transcript_92706/g.239400 Transcript_92706/m.239400 type:complete len:264 (-) Transcript_92706:172-963(-)